MAAQSPHLQINRWRSTFVRTHPRDVVSAFYLLGERRSEGSHLFFLEKVGVLCFAPLEETANRHLFTSRHCVDCCILGRS